MIVALQAAGIYGAVALTVLWLMVIVAIIQDAFAPQPGLVGRFSSRPIQARPLPPSVALTERIQARIMAAPSPLALPVAPWRPTA